MASASPPVPFFVARFLASLLFVFATYNPTGYSLYHWIVDSGSYLLSLKAIVAVALAMLYYAVFRVMLAALRRSGLIVGAIAALLFALEIATVIVPARTRPTWHYYGLVGQYVALGALAILVSFGMSWSHLVEQLTGQLQKRYVRR